MTRFRFRKNVSEEFIKFRVKHISGVFIALTERSRFEPGLPVIKLDAKKLCFGKQHLDGETKYLKCHEIELSASIHHDFWMILDWTEINFGLQVTKRLGKSLGKHQYKSLPRTNFVGFSSQVHNSWIVEKGILKYTG